MLTYDKTVRCFLKDGNEITFSPEELTTMRSLTWWQSIPFSSSVQSPGYFRCAELIEKFFLDKLDLQGKTVLGIGCYEGFQLYMAEALGASRVVCLTDTFGHTPSIDSAREFTAKKLGSAIEFISMPFDSMTPENIGQFDIVFFFDALPHVQDPYKALHTIDAISKSAFFLTTPVVLSEIELSACYRLTSPDPHNTNRNKHGVTKLWIIKELQEKNLHLEPVKVWEHDYFSLCAVKKAPQIVVEPPSIDTLPSDEGMEDKTAVLVMSCKLYEQCWMPFFTLFQRYWPDCPYRVYLGTDTGTYPGVETLQVGKDLHWASNILEILPRIDAERIILFQEDFLLYDKVDTARVRKFVRHTFDQNIASLRMHSYPSPTTVWQHAKEFGSVGPFDDFRFSFQLSIWDKAFYSSLMRPGEDPWTTEYVAARRSILRDRPFVNIWAKVPSPIPYLTYAVDKGEWQETALELLKREGISLSGITKKIRSPLHT